MTRSQLMWLLVSLIAGDGACSGLCFSGECSGFQESAVFLGSVKDVKTNATLVKVCTLLDDKEQRNMMRFHAPAGSIVEEEILLEGRIENFQGHNPDPAHSGAAFWCSNVAKANSSATWSFAAVHTCLMVTDIDPPAKILAIEPRGVSPAGGATSSGYALRLEILHPGVLHVRSEAACEETALGLPIPDGGFPPNPPGDSVELEVL